MRRPANKIFYNKIKQYIETHIDLIENNDFETLYQRAETELNGGVAVMTDLFLEAGINPLAYLSYIPTQYQFGGQQELLVIPSHIRSIRSYAYAHNYFDSIVIPKNIKTIGYGAFKSCSDLKFIDIQEGVLSITDYAFANCGHIQKVKLPSTIGALGKDIFSYNDSIIEIEYNGTEDDWIRISKSNDLFLKSKAIVKGLDFEKEYGIS